MREQFYLALPMKPLCREDCQGLCVVCGANLNRATCDCKLEWDDPRLAALPFVLETPKGPAAAKVPVQRDEFDLRNLAQLRALPSRLHLPENERPYLAVRYRLDGPRGRRDRDARRRRAAPQDRSARA